MVQQYYHHSYYPTPPVMLVSAYFADCVVLAQQCCLLETAWCKRDSVVQKRQVWGSVAPIQHYLGCVVSIPHLGLCCIKTTVLGINHNVVNKQQYLSSFIKIRVFPNIFE